MKWEPIRKPVQTAKKKKASYEASADVQRWLREQSIEEARPLFDGLMQDVEVCLAHKRIHGDLSAYNILYWQGTVTIIDLAQAVDAYYDEVFPIFVRDIERICDYFAPYGVEADAQAMAASLWTSYMGGQLPD